jgi:hypothetical protein
MAKMERQSGEARVHFSFFGKGECQHIEPGILKKCVYI